MNKGRFISLEGGEGAGKSTQAKMLGESLQSLGFDAVVTREPGGTPGAEAIRLLLLDTAGEGWNLNAEALLFAAARSDHVDRLIRPALAAGRWVICDRFVDSSRAYQGGAGGLADADLMELHRIGSGGLLPDLTLLIDVSPGEVENRLKKRDIAGADRIGGRNAGYHAAVRAAFDRFALAEPGRIARIDGNGSAEATHRQIMRALRPLLEGA